MTTYERGSIFLCDQKTAYMIVRSGDKGRSVGLIDMSGGNIWSTDVEVKDVFKITEEELRELSGTGKFTFLCGPLDRKRLRENIKALLAAEDVKSVLGVNHD